MISFEITPEERLRRLGRILARGVLILHDREKKGKKSLPNVDGQDK